MKNKNFCTGYVCNMDSNGGISIMGGLQELDILKCENEIENKQDKFGKCYVFPKKFIFDDDFLKNPIANGMCLYKTWCGVVYE